MESKNASYLIITAFVALIVGISLLGVTASSSQPLTLTQEIVNESMSIASIRGPGGIANATLNITIARQYNSPWKWTECPLTGLSIQNGTKGFTLNTDYFVQLDKGILSFNNSATVNGTVGTGPNTTYLSYTYCDNTYLTQAWSRSIQNTVIGLLAMILLVYAVTVFFIVFRSAGGQ